MFVAQWNDQELARSRRALRVEGALYFPPETVNWNALKPGSDTSYCEWKGGRAEYFDLDVAGARNQGAAWRYPSLGPAVREIEGWVSFWRGVDVRWHGEGAPKVQDLTHQLPNVAKALGASDVVWRPSLPFLPEQENFTGYSVPSLRLAVDVLADPGETGRQQVFDTALQRASAARDQGDNWRYIAVWGSTAPSDSALALLAQGKSVIDLLKPAVGV